MAGKDTRAFALYAKDGQRFATPELRGITSTNGANLDAIALADQHCHLILYSRIPVAQLAEADIYLGSSRMIGRLSVDAGLIRAEAGPLEPRLVVPIRVEMHNQPSEQMLVLTAIVARLHLGDENNPATQVGLPATADLIPGFHARSLPDGRSQHQLDLRFQLTPASIQRLEIARHSGLASPLELKIKCDCVVAWIRETWGEANASSHGRAGNVAAEDPFKMQYGLHSSLSWFWTVSMNPLRVQVEQSVWLSNVLPGFGIDSHRLIELWLPPSSPGGPSGSRAWDEALRAYNARNYSECVSQCRAVVAAWNKKAGSTKSRPMGNAIAEAKGWSDKDPRIPWINSVWQAVVDMGNAAHHPEAGADRHDVDAADARLHLLSIAILS